MTASNVKQHAPSIRPIRASELDAAHELERASYTADAAASREAFAFRQETFPNYFLSAWRNDALVGLACGVRTDESTSGSDDVKGAHSSVSEGRHLCVLSVAVAAAERRRGTGSLLMEALIHQAQGDKLETIVLMCEAHLIAFYERHGFRYEGPSASAHGGIEWHEMQLALQG